MRTILGVTCRDCYFAYGHDYLTSRLPESEMLNYISLLKKLVESMVFNDFGQSHSDHSLRSRKRIHTEIVVPRPLVKKLLETLLS